jgi:hypothetical protein
MHGRTLHPMSIGLHFVKRHQDDFDLFVMASADALPYEGVPGGGNDVIIGDFAIKRGLAAGLDLLYCRDAKLPVTCTIPCLDMAERLTPVPDLRQVIERVRAWTQTEDRVSLDGLDVVAQKIKEDYAKVPYNTPRIGERGLGGLEAKASAKAVDQLAEGVMRLALAAQAIEARRDSEPGAKFKNQGGLLFIAGNSAARSVAWVRQLACGYPPDGRRNETWVKSEKASQLEDFLSIVGCTREGV